MAPRQHLAGNVLVVEDEPSISDVVATALRHRGHCPTVIDDGLVALERATSEAFDLIVLDVMLPSMDGLEICRRLRSRGVDTPVLFLTARGDAGDRVNGFVAGGDDYLPKPFSIDELLLRVAAILRRTERPGESSMFVVGDITVDTEACSVVCSDVRIELSATEYRLLEYLMRNVGIVVSKAQILANVWDDDFDGSDNVVELYVGYLRRKLDDQGSLIRTRRGMGYVMESEHTR